MTDASFAQPAPAIAEPIYPSNTARTWKLVGIVASALYGIWAIMTVYFWRSWPNSEEGRLTAMVTGDGWREIASTLDLPSVGVTYAEIWSDITRTAMLRLAIPAAVVGLLWLAVIVLSKRQCDRR